MRVLRFLFRFDDEKFLRLFGVIFRRICYNVPKQEEAMETDHETTDHETSLRRVRRVAAALLAAAGLTADAAPQIDVRFDDARG